FVATGELHVEAGGGPGFLRGSAGDDDLFDVLDDLGLGGGAALGPTLVADHAGLVHSAVGNSRRGEELVADLGRDGFGGGLEVAAGGGLDREQPSLVLGHDLGGELVAAAGDLGSSVEG